MKSSVFPLVRVAASAISAVLVIAGCAPGATATPIPTIALDRTTSVGTSGPVKASAEVVPAMQSQLSFVISGMVKDVMVKEGDQVQAGQALIKLDTKELEFSVAAAEADLTSAQIDATMQRYRRKYTNRNGKVVYTSGPREKILIADAKVAQKQATLDTAKALLAQGTLLAPFDATVVSIKVKPGEYVSPGQVVIELATLDQLQVETTDLSELNVTAVQIGQPATVFVEALKQNFPGKVIAISPISNKIGGDVVFKVTIKMDEQSNVLLWGMSADVDINVE